MAERSEKLTLIRERLTEDFLLRRVRSLLNQVGTIHCPSNLVRAGFDMRLSPSHPSQHRFKALRHTEFPSLYCLHYIWNMNYWYVMHPRLKSKDDIKVIAGTDLEKLLKGAKLYWKAKWRIQGANYIKFNKNWTKSSSIYIEPHGVSQVQGSDRPGTPLIHPWVIGIFPIACTYICSVLWLLNMILNWFLHLLNFISLDSLFQDDSNNILLALFWYRQLWLFKFSNKSIFF